jgi:UPF0755 protein
MAVKKGWIGVILLLDIILAASILDSYLGQQIKIPTLIYVPNKESSQIVESLVRQGVPLLPIDYYWLDELNINKDKWIRFDKNLTIISREKFLEKLEKSPYERTRRLVVYSGDSIEDFAKGISNNTGIPKERLIHEYRLLSPYEDGGILAGFYKIPYRAIPRAIVSYMTEYSEDRFKKISTKFLGDYSPEKFKKYLIIASIIQKETWRDEEKPLISAVIYNRLKKDIKLQLDATLNYGKYSHKRVTPWRIRHDKTHFNTYRYKGLPPEPLGSVSFSALEAAFRPANVNYIYFVRDILGRHVFASTYEEHLANITKIKVMRAKVRKFKRYLKPKSRHRHKSKSKLQKHQKSRGS